MMTLPLILIALSASIAAATPVNASAATADIAAQTARDAAKADRHDDAISAFRRAIFLAPERRSEWLLELADQLTWSQRPNEAIPLYREVAQGGEQSRQRVARIGLGRALSWTGRYRAAIAEYDAALILAPGDRDVRLARAQVLSWANRLGAALVSYDAILRDNPGDPEARRGRAQMLSWRGRHRAAIAEAQAVLADRPGDRGATLILAETLAWMGRPDRADAILRHHLALDREDERAKKLQADLRRSARPEVRIDVRTFDQSDNLEIDETAFDLHVPLGSGRGSTGVRYARAIYRPGGDRSARITVQRPAVYGGYRISDAVALNAAIAVDIIDNPAGRPDRAPLTFETYLTYRPNDLLRLDVGASRVTFDSEDTLAIGLTGTQLGASIDIEPDDRTVLSGRISRTRYSDGNRRLWWQSEVNRRIMNSPRIVIGYRYTNFDYRLPGQRGYYNPDRFDSHEIVARGSGRIGPKLRWDVRVTGGYETETPGGSRPTVNLGANLTREISKAIELEAAYDFSTSRTLSTGGFQRGIARLTLRARF